MKLKEILSENRSEREEGTKVTKIVLMASLMKDAEAQAKELQPARRQRSFHYIIGCDGKIVRGVPEEFRAWSAKNRKLDSDAVSILVCTNGIPDCNVTPEAWDSLVSLCADLCKRYKVNPCYVQQNLGTFVLYFVGSYIKNHMQALTNDIIEVIAKEKAAKRKGGTKK